MKESSSAPHLRSALVHESRPSASTARALLLFTLSLLLLLAWSSICNGQDQLRILARVGEQTISQQDVDDTVGGQVYALEQQLFALRKAVLNNLINKKVLEAEAARQRVSIEELKDRWMSGPVVVDPDQVNDLYIKNRAAFGLMSEDEAKQKLRLDLEGQVRLKRYRDELAAVRGRTRVDVLIDEPRLAVDKTTNKGAMLGPGGAPVVITEFSDFQCPYCKEVQNTLRRVVQRYPTEVRLEFKHFPIETHPFALTAARAAYCGAKQDAFWQLHDALFAVREPSQTAVLEIVRKLKLDAGKFETCLSSDESKDAVVTDLEEARRLGIEGTPTFVINGRPLRGAASFDEFINVIEHELKRVHVRSSTSQN